jgi:uncharacterized membrane protein
LGSGDQRRKEIATATDLSDIRFGTTRTVMRWILAAFFVAAGVAHLAVPDVLAAITPDWVPFAPQVIFITGLCEFAGAAALVTRPLRRSAGIAFAVYAVCVWPANFKHAVDGIDIPHISSSWWYHAPRLAFQPVIVWWALFSAGVIEWPLARRRETGAALIGPRDNGKTPRGKERDRRREEQG